MGECKPPYKYGDKGKWCDCEFQGVFRPECYEYLKVDYECTKKPDCPDRVVVIEVCNTNAITDDNIRVLLNGTVIAPVLNFEAMARTGYFIIADPDAILELPESMLCKYGGPGGCACLMESPLRFDPDLIRGGQNDLELQLVKDNKSGNKGAFIISSYIKRDGKLICGCVIQTVNYGVIRTYQFTYDSCCGLNETPPCPTPIPDGSGSGSGSSGIWSDDLPNFISFENIAEIETEIKMLSTTNDCKTEFELETDGCCIEYLADSKIARAVGDGSISIVSGSFMQTPTNCCDKIGIHLNGSAIYSSGSYFSKSVKDGDVLSINIYNDCKCRNPTKTISGTTYKPPECPKITPYRILKNNLNNKYKIILNKTFFRR